MASTHSFVGDEQTVTTTDANSQLQCDFGADVDALEEVIMGINVTDRGTVGCAYYVAREETLYFMEDAKLGGGDIVENRKTVTAYAATHGLTHLSEAFHRPDSCVSVHSM